MPKSLFKWYWFKSGSMLSMTKVDLNLIPYVDKYLLFKKGRSGGVSCISKRYGKTNNKYLASYDPKEQRKHIKYLDAINLYSYTPSRSLPTDRFKWIDPTNFDLNKHISQIV